MADTEKAKQAQWGTCETADGPHQPLCHQSLWARQWPLLLDQSDYLDRFTLKGCSNWRHTSVDWLPGILVHSWSQSLCESFASFSGTAGSIEHIVFPLPFLRGLFNIVLGRKKTYQRLEQDFKTLKKKLLLCCKWRSVGSKLCNSTKSFRQSVQRLHRRVWKCHGRANQLDTSRLVGLVGRHKQIVESEV